MNGTFANVSAPLQVKFYVRKTAKVGGAQSTTPAPTIVQGTPDTFQQQGIVRDPANPANGSFTGFVNIAGYDTANFTYEMRVEFWSGQAYMGAYTANGSEWLPIP